MGTRNWYRSVLSDVFPEVRHLRVLPDPDEDKDSVKEMFLRRFLNFRHTLCPMPVGAAGKNAQTVGLLKGHISVGRPLELKDLPEDERKRLNDDKSDRLARREEANAVLANSKSFKDQSSWEKFKGRATQLLQGGASVVEDLSKKAEEAVEAVSKFVPGLQGGPPLL